MPRTAGQTDFLLAAAVQQALEEIVYLIDRITAVPAQAKLLHLLVLLVLRR